MTIKPDPRIGRSIRFSDPEWELVERIAEERSSALDRKVNPSEVVREAVKEVLGKPPPDFLTR